MASMASAAWERFGGSCERWMAPSSKRPIRWVDTMTSAGVSASCSWTAAISCARASARALSSGDRSSSAWSSGGDSSGLTGCSPPGVHRVLMGCVRSSGGGWGGSNGTGPRLWFPIGGDIGTLGGHNRAESGVLPTQPPMVSRVLRRRCSRWPSGIHGDTGVVLCPRHPSVPVQRAGVGFPAPAFLRFRPSTRPLVGGRVPPYPPGKEPA